MANLEQIMAETSKSYDNSRKALNDQINAISGDLEAQKGRIDAQYAQQSKQLDRQRNMAASAASMNAARTGGSFGGSAAIANDKYYQQAYVPAVTQMQTNKANDISSAEEQANQRQLSLQQTLAQLNDEANRYALQRYDAAVEAEREEAYRQAQLALQRQQLAQSYGGGSSSSGSSNPYSLYTDDSGGTQFINSATGKAVTFGTYAKGFGANGNAQILQVARQALNDADYNRLARIVSAQSTTKHPTLKITGYTDGSAIPVKLSASDRAFMGRLGLGF